MSSSTMIDAAARPGRQFPNAKSTGFSPRHLLATVKTTPPLPWVLKAPAAGNRRLRLDYTASGLHAPFYLAIKRGWFEKAGIDLYMEDGNGSSATVKLVGAGSFDLGLHSLGPLAVARAMKVPVIS